MYVVSELDILKVCFISKWLSLCFPLRCVPQSMGDMSIVYDSLVSAIVADDMTMNNNLVIFENRQ